MFPGQNLFSLLYNRPKYLYDLKSSTEKCVLLSCYVHLFHHIYPAQKIHKEMRNLRDCGKIIKSKIPWNITRRSSFDFIAVEFSISLKEMLSMNLAMERAEGWWKLFIEKITFLSRKEIFLLTNRYFPEMLTVYLCK